MGIFECVLLVLLVVCIMLIILLSIALKIICTKYYNMKTEINKLHKNQELQEYLLEGHNETLKVFQKILKNLLLTEQK